MGFKSGNLAWRRRRLRPFSIRLATSMSVIFNKNSEKSKPDSLAWRMQGSRLQEIAASFKNFRFSMSCTFIAGFIGHLLSDRISIRRQAATLANYQAVGYGSLVLPGCFLKYGLLLHWC